MSTETYLTQDGDTVDMIAYTRFGEHGMEVAILEANPELAAIGPVLPIGMTIIIPTPLVKDRTTSQSLWD